jgi:hypothetical protein
VLVFEHSCACGRAHSVRFKGGSLNRVWSPTAHPGCNRIGHGLQLHDVAKKSRKYFCPAMGFPFGKTSGSTCSWTLLEERSGR